MSHPQSRDRLDREVLTDVGVVAAMGVYAAVVFVMLAISVALALEVATPTVVGSVSTAATAGLVGGALFARRTEQLSERVAGGLRSLAPLFVPSVAFVLATVVALAWPGMANRVAIGTGFGALAMAAAAWILASMMRTRYARTMATDEPALRVSWHDPRTTSVWVGIGVASLAGSVLALRLIAGTPRVLVAAWLATSGLVAVWAGIVHRRAPERLEDTAPSRSTGRYHRPFDAKWPSSRAADTDAALEVHDAGLVLKRPLQRRFVPWTDVEGVRLTDRALVLERSGWTDLRCTRSVLDDPDAVAETIEQVRTGGAGERS